MKDHTTFDYSPPPRPFGQPAMMAEIPHTAGGDYISICAACSGGMGDYYGSK